MSSLKRYAMVLFLAPALIPFFSTAQPSSWFDSASSRYLVASKRYDRALLEKIAESITRQPGAERPSAKATLLLGMTYWRLEFIAFCLDDDAAVERWGVKAIDALNEAERAKADVYLTASHKSFASQVIASLGMLKAMKWGPLSEGELKNAQKANPQGYFSLLAEAVNTSRAPPFAGGNLKKAVVMLEKLAKDFPDSAEVKIHLADAYIRTGKRDEGRALILPIVQSNPSDLFAKKTAERLEQK
jgi:hypothetical protein